MLLRVRPGGLLCVGGKLDLACPTFYHPSSMKIFHLADLHLGKAVYGRELLEDQELILDQVLDSARRDKPAALVVAGDVFDRAVPSADAVRLFGRFIAGLKDLDPDMVVALIPGNHDSGARLAYLSAVLGRTGIHIRSDADECDTPVVVRRDGQTLRLWLVPFLTPGAFPPSEQPNASGLGELFDDAARPVTLRSQADLFSEAVRRIRAAKDGLSSAADVLVCHVFAAGGGASESERAFLGTAELVDASMFDAFDYAALGHLHRPQAAGSRGRYPGSPLRYSFADDESERGFLKVELRPGGADAELVPLKPLRAMRRIQGAFRELLDEVRWSGFEGDYVEAVLSDAEPVLNPVDALRRRFPWLLSVRQEAFEREQSDAPGLPSAGAQARDIVDEFRSFHRVVLGRDTSANMEELFIEFLKEARDAARQA